MIPPRPTELAQMILRQVIHEGDIVIDATAGNGHDTVFLGQCVGVNGRVLAFDVQEQAIRNARLRVADAGLIEVVEFHHSSHANMADYAEAGRISAIMFNLGYLPGENHALTTVTTETLCALEAAAELLKSGGSLSVVCYPGHEDGKEEAGRVEEWFNCLPDHGWRVAKYAMQGTLKEAPFLLLGSKKK